MRVNKPHRGYLRVIGIFTAILSVVPFVIVCVAMAAALCILIIPTFIMNCSLFIGIFPNDMVITQRYFDHFEALYPDLILAVQSNTQTQHQESDTNRLKHWPSKNSPGPGDFVIKTQRNGTYYLSASVALFWQLENAGIERKVLWQFLADKVEASVTISDEDQAEFRKIMQKLCPWTFVNVFILVIVWMGWAANGWWRPMRYDYVVPESPHYNRRVVPVISNTVDWILEKGALLVPVDEKAYKMMSPPLRRTALAIIGAVEWNSDLKDMGNYWQVVDLRRQDLVVGS
jgi:hypothetical protein